MWALSKLDTLDEVLFEAIVKAVLHKLPKFNAQNVANTVTAPFPTLFAAWIIATLLFLPCFLKVLALAETKLMSDYGSYVQIWGFANLSFDPGQALWDAVAQNCMHTVHEYSPQNIANGACSELLMFYF